MYLFINTTGEGHIDVFLFNSEELFHNRLEGGRKASESLLVLIDETLKTAQRSRSDIRGVAVVNGPGSFTALRIAVTVANTLGYALHVPVAGVSADLFEEEWDLETNKETIITQIKTAQVGSIVVPEYGKEPNITIKE